MESKFKVLLVYPNVPGSTLLPIGVASLAGSLKANDIDVELFDCTFYDDDSMDNFEQKKMELLQVKPFKPSWESKGDYLGMIADFQDTVMDYKPDLIGISLVEDTIDQGLSLLESIQTIFKGFTVAGGVGVNWNQDKLLDSGLIHILCIGEGEETLVKICKMLEDPYGKHYIYPEIQGTIWRNIVGQDIKENGFPEPLDINKLPFPDYSIFPKERMTRIMQGKEFKMLQVEVDRGCPYQCTYCCAPALKKMYGKGYYRKKNIDGLIDELKYLKEKYNPNYIDLNSETLLARRKDDLAYFSNLYKKHIKILFWCQGRPEDVTRYKLFILKEAGLVDFQLGIEHGNFAFRKKWLKRKGTNIQIKEACELLTEYQIYFTVNNIIGFPDETRELVFDTINLNREIDSPYLKTMNVYMMNPYKGTWMYDYCVKEGLLDPEAKSNQLLGGKDIKYKYMTKEEFLGLQRTFPLYVKGDHPDEKIRIAERFDKKGQVMFEGLALDYKRRYYS